MDPTNAKALFRRGTALAKSGSPEGAIADLVYVDTFSVGDVPAANADGGATAVGTNPATRTGS